MVNPDDHDRILTDPAYRMEKTLKSEELFKIYAHSLQQIDHEYEKNFGNLPVYPMNRVDYTTLIDVEKAIMKIDRNLKKVNKFQSRKFIDPANHSRREKRMLERASARWEQSMTFYYGNLTEEEQKYRDYYETDLEKYPENEKVEEKLDEQSILGRDEYKLDRYDFQELYTNNPEDDQTTLIERKIFQFKYRMALDKQEVFERRNQKMIEAHMQRFNEPTFVKEWNELRQTVTQDPHNHEAAKKYLEFLRKESVQQFKDYYYDDTTQDFSLLEHLSGPDQAKFTTVFENHTVYEGDISGFVTFPKRQWNNNFGLWMNFYLDLKEAVVDLRPKTQEVLMSAEELSQQNITKQLEEWKKDTKNIENQKKLKDN